MGRFLDPPTTTGKTYKGRFLDEEPLAQQSNSLKKRSFGPVGFGPLGYGVESVDEGLSKKDIPFIAAKAGSGAFYGVPERVAKNPTKFGMSGPVGVGLDPYSYNETNAFFPKPASKGGEMIGNAAELAAGVGPAAEALSGLKLGANRAANISSKFGKLRKETKQVQGLSEELLSGAQKGRKNVGARYEEYIDKFGDENIDANATSELLQKLPKDIIEELKINPNVERITDDLGRVMIKPTLRNAKAIRDIVRGDVSSKFWNPKLIDEPTKKAADFVYDEIGKIMRTGREDLGNIMKNYSKAKSAIQELSPALRTPKGFTKTRPVLKMFGEGAEGSRQQAVESLSKYNPEILETVEKIRKFGEGAKRKEAINTFVKRLAGGALLGAGGSLGYKLFKS